MGLISRCIKKHTTPAFLTPKDGITYWQERVLLTLLCVTVVAGLIVYIPSVLLSIKEHLWLIVILDTFIYFYLLFLFLKPSLPYTFRAITIPLVAYLLGMVLTLTLGPFGAGPVWIFFFPIIAGILLGSKLAFAALVINAITLLALGGIIHFQLTDLLVAMNFRVWHLATDNPLEKWIVIGLNFILLNGVATACVNLILNGLQKSIAELGRSDKKHRQIFENILDVYFETSLEGIIQVVSPSVKQVSQYTTKELKGRSMFDLYADPLERDKTIQNLTRTGFLNDHGIRLLNKDGTMHYCSINARLLTDGTGKPDKIIGILRDISNQKAIEHERKELEERLSRSQKMEALGLLAGGVAHDLNNILSGIVTYPEVLCMDLEPDDPLRKSLEIIQSSGHRASEIVQDLLTLSRRGVVTRDVLNLNDLVTRFLKTPEYEKILSFHPHIQVKKQLDADMPFVKGSSVHLGKALINLISNAAEAQLDGGQINVSTRSCHLDTPLKGYDRVETGDYVVLSVQDHGTGILPEDLKRIFEPFFTKKTMGRSGTGLGMAVVWGTVQDHEGYIDIQSSAARGSTFDLYFPMCENMSLKKDSPFCLDDIKGDGQTILIIDDIKEQRQIATISLEKLGYHAISVDSGEAAIRFLKKEPADILLLDMIMEPGIDGFETYQRILSFKPHQKAIIASGYSQTLQVEKTLKLGAGQYLKKPYTLERLGIAVKKELS